MEKKFTTLANHETIAYLEKVKGEKNLILIHGNFSSGVYYKPLLDRLPEGIHAYAPDLRGYGDSSYINRILSMKDFARDVKLFMDSIGLEKADVVGWSLGGNVAMELAAHYPAKVNKLILINSGSHKGYPVFKKDASGRMIFGETYASADEMANDPVQVKPLLDAQKAKNFAFVKYIFDVTIYTVNKPTDEDNFEYINETMKQVNLPDADYALASQNMSCEPNSYKTGENTIHRIQAPVLHFWGDKDITVPESMIFDNINALKAQSTYIKFDHCGHSPLVDKPDELANAIIEFIR
ncbi:MAG: alpha/beta hydrolase [Firmicutes bacterium]|nr:alpha/beta hydrolase [Bacillota bacterium]